MKIICECMYDSMIYILYAGGLIGGGLVFLGGISVLIFVVVRRKKQQQAQASSQPSPDLSATTILKLSNESSTHRYNNQTVLSSDTVTVVSGTLSSINSIYYLSCLS